MNEKKRTKKTLFINYFHLYNVRPTLYDTFFIRQYYTDAFSEFLSKKNTVSFLQKKSDAITRQTKKSFFQLLCLANMQAKLLIR